MSDQVNPDRRRFVGTAAMTLATAALNSTVAAQPARKVLDRPPSRQGRIRHFNR